MQFAVYSCALLGIDHYFFGGGGGMKIFSRQTIFSVLLSVQTIFFPLHLPANNFFGVFVIIIIIIIIIITFIYIRLKFIR